MVTRICIPPIIGPKMHISGHLPCKTTCNFITENLDLHKTIYILKKGAMEMKSGRDKKIFGWHISEQWPHIDKISVADCKSNRQVQTLAHLRKERDQKFFLCNSLEIVPINNKMCQLLAAMIPNGGKMEKFHQIWVVKLCHFLKQPRVKCLCGKLNFMLGTLTYISKLYKTYG